MGALTGSTCFILSLYLCIQVANSAICEDSPSFDCATLDRSRQICSKYLNSEETNTFCPKYCGLCSDGTSTHTPLAFPAAASSSSTATSVWTTVVPYNGPCVDDPAMDCADMNRTAHICTAFPNSDQTRKYCPKFCGLCGKGWAQGHCTKHIYKPGNRSPTSSATITSSAVQHITSVPYNGPCKDDPTFDCADIDRTAQICTTYRDSEETKKYCPKFCGLCGTAGVTPSSSSVGTSAMTSSSFTGPCVDASGADCADLDHTAKICTVYRDSQNTKDLCPRYCHLCTPDPTPPSTCRDADGADCADLDQTAHICTTYRDSENTRELCPKYCGLCSDGASKDKASTLPGGSTTGHQSPTKSSHSHKTTPRQMQIKTTPIHPDSTSTMPKKTTTPRRPDTTAAKSTDTSTPRRLDTTAAKSTDTSTPRRPDTIAAMSTDTNTPSRPDTTSAKPTVKTTPVQHTDRITSRAPTTSKHPKTTATPLKTTHTVTAAPASMTTPSLEQIFAMSFYRNDINHDGILTLLDFEKLWIEQDVNGDQRVTISEYAAVSHFSKFITTELFQFIDHDHNGVITIQEVPHLFMEYDSNSDGVIDKGEFIAEFRRIYNFVKDHVK